MLADMVKIIPIEVVLRNLAAGSLCKQTPIPLGTELSPALLDFYYKDDNLSDPLLTEARLERLGLVTKKFNDFFLVDLLNNDSFQNGHRLLCKIRKSVNFKNKLIYVGDEVQINRIDFQTKRAIIQDLIQRRNLLVRPSVANVSNIYVICSVHPYELPCKTLHGCPFYRDTKFHAKS